MAKRPKTYNKANQRVGQRGKQAQTKGKKTPQKRQSMVGKFTSFATQKKRNFMLILMAIAIGSFLLVYFVFSFSLMQSLGVAGIVFAIPTILIAQREWFLQNQVRGIAILILLIVPFSFFIVFGAVIQLQGTGTSGYMTFELIDGETGEILDGELYLVDINDTTKPTDADMLEDGIAFDSDVAKADGETVYYFSEPIVVSVKSVVLADTDPRVVGGYSLLPKSISPFGSEDSENPRKNSIVVFWMNDKSDFEFNITKINDVTGNYDHDNFTADTLYTIELRFEVLDIRNSFGTYGDFSFVPEYTLEKLGKTKTLDYEIGGYGLWFCINGTDVIDVESELGEYYTYIDDVGANNFSMIGVAPMFFFQDVKVRYQELTFEMKKAPTNIFIFEGFIDELEDNRIDIFVENP